MDARLKALDPEFIQRAQKIFSPSRLNLFYKSCLEPKTTTFRINTLKSDDHRVEKTLFQLKIKFEKEKQLSSCYYLPDLSQKKIEDLSLYQNGEIYLQNLSSQLPPVILNPLPGDLVLDLCASPGSKTTQIAALMKNDGKIIAVEPEKIRFDRLQHNLNLLGCLNVEPVFSRGETFCQRHLLKKEAPLFDKILLDAPCSGDGTIYINNKKTYAHWSKTFVQKCSSLQKKLLASALQVCRPGGLILYSTCSISPEENELVIHDLLSSNPQLNILSLKQKLPQNIIYPPLTSWASINLNPKIKNSIRIFPSKITEGFFMTLIQK